MICAFLSGYKKADDQKSRIICSRCLQSIHRQDCGCDCVHYSKFIGYNLAIFQNIVGQAIIIFTQCINKNTSDTLYLKYDYCPGFDSTNHYSAIVIKKNEVQQPTQPPTSKPTPPPPSQPTQPPASNPTPPPPSQLTQPSASNPTPPLPSQPTQPHASNPAPPPTLSCEKLQEESSENEEPVNIEHIQNQINDLQKKQNPHGKRKGIKSTCIILKMLTLI